MYGVSGGFAWGVVDYCEIYLSFGGLLLLLSPSAALFGSYVRLDRSECGIILGNGMLTGGFLHSYHDVNP